jgi:hypothetical protein
MKASGLSKLEDGYILKMPNVVANINVERNQFESSSQKKGLVLRFTTCCHQSK